MFAGLRGCLDIYNLSKYPSKPANIATSFKIILSSFIYFTPFSGKGIEIWFITWYPCQ